MNFQHRCKILYTPDYTKITNIMLLMDNILACKYLNYVYVL
jgi:hypothetical protein